MVQEYRVTGDGDDGEDGDENGTVEMENVKVVMLPVRTVEEVVEVMIRKA